MICDVMDVRDAVMDVRDAVMDVRDAVMDVMRDVELATLSTVFTSHPASTAWCLPHADYQLTCPITHHTRAFMRRTAESTFSYWREQAAKQCALRTPRAIRQGRTFDVSGGCRQF
jgi:hypothetical protein